MEKAIDVAKFYKDLFGDDFYLELQVNGLPEQEKVNEGLLEIGEKLGIKAVATADCHYLDKEDAFAHEVLLCIQTGKTLNDPDRFRFNTDQLYLASSEEMKERFKNYPKEILENTLEVFEKINLELKLGEPLFPKAKVPAGYSEKEYFLYKAREGLKNALKSLKNEEPFTQMKKHTGKDWRWSLKLLWKRAMQGIF